MSRKPLHVYYTIDLSSVQDTTLLERCLQVYINVHAREHTLLTYTPIERAHEQTEPGEPDTIDCGIGQFNSMFDKLKLKTTDDTWFIYVSQGRVTTSQNMFVVLLNSEPRYQKCFYVITCDLISKKIDKNTLQLFNKTLTRLFTQKRTITY